MIKKALVTGASGYVGGAVARQLIKDGFEVTAHYRSETRLDDLFERLGAVAVWQADFLEGSLQPPSDDFDVVVHAAFLLTEERQLHNDHSDDLRRALDVNVLAPYRITAALIPHMLDQHWGRVVVIGSIYDAIASTQNTNYTICKHAIAGLTRSVARDYAQFGVTANQIDPAALSGGMTLKLVEELHMKRGIQPAETIARITANSPRGTLLDAEEVAAVVSFITSDRASGVSGHLLRVDGGQLA